MSEYEKLNELIKEVDDGSDRYHLSAEELTELKQFSAQERNCTIRLKAKSMLINCGFVLNEVFELYCLGWTM